LSWHFFADVPRQVQSGKPESKLLDFPKEDSLLFKRNVFARLFVMATAVAFLLLASSAVFAQTKLPRFPDIHGDRVAFTYGGDIWTASASGGPAIRLTAHPGVEVFAKFSPDSNWIASWSNGGTAGRQLGF
jgi:tricorn protease-like protein